MDDPYEDFSSMKSELPVLSREIGCLTQPSPQESNFLGSSSGVYFINTVRKAFARSAICSRQGNNIPLAEQIVGDDAVSDAGNRPRPAEFQIAVGPGQSVQGAVSFALGTFPSFEKAQQYSINYFRTGHPLFPFLSGPIFLQELQRLYRNSDLLARTGQVQVDRKQLCILIITRCVLLIGAQETEPGESLPRTQVLSMLSVLASQHDVLTLQTMLAAQLYCVATLAPRTASTLSGVLGRLLVHAGLHRCPYRYNLTEEQRNLRKRIFWSAYTLDRHLCMCLGLPVTLSDFEIDVCISGREELHVHPEDTAYPTPGQDPPQSQVFFCCDKGGSDDDDLQPRKALSKPGDASLKRRIHRIIRQKPTDRQERSLASFVEMSTLVGRVLHTFHRSIHVRSISPEDVLQLRTDVEKWVNSLPDADASRRNNDDDDQEERFLPFFHVMYEQLVIYINRPALSLPRSLPEFHHSLQITIKAAKNTISGLEKQTHLFWPGYVPSVWMSGLILSFASQIGLYNVTQAATEVQRCLALLSRMSKRWESVRHCHAGLLILYDELRQPSFAEQDDQHPNAKRSRPDEASAGPMPADGPAPTITDPGPDPATSTPDFAASQAFNPDANDFFQDLAWDNLFDNGAYPFTDDFCFAY